MTAKGHKRTFGAGLLCGPVYPTKERPENKIDPVVALIMALARALLPGETATAPLFFRVDDDAPIRPLW